MRRAELSRIFAQRLALPQASTSNEYRIIAALPAGYAALGANGRPALLMPLQAAATAGDKRTRGFELRFESEVHFRTGSNSQKCAAAVVELVNENLLDSFCAIILDIANSTRNEDPIPAMLDSKLQQWRELFRSITVLSQESEIGLWGELAFIVTSPNPQLALNAWRGPEAGLHDFRCGGIGIECKTSRLYLTHWISHDQVARATGKDLLVSYHLGIDPIAGRTLPQSIDEVEQLLEHSEMFWEKLTAAGYSSEHSTSYTTPWVLQNTSVFSMEDVPHVLEWTPGVKRLKYQVEIKEDFILRDGRERVNTALRGTSSS